MRLKNVSLFAFKNYSEASLEFSDGINCLIGPNGSGKTNLLDAINYLSMTKSSLSSIDSQSILHDEKLGSINGIFQKNSEEYKVTCGLQLGLKKVFKVNQQEYEKLSEHIGQFPVVLIAPNDTDIIRDGNEVRRKFFDSILSQLDTNYLSNLIKYNHYLKQRNSLLKQFSQSSKPDYDQLSPYDHQLTLIGKQLYQMRKGFIDRFIPILETHYANLSEQKESIGLKYNSHSADANFEKIFQRSLQKDLILQRTNIGVHKDEYLFEIDSRPLKKFGSQGQQKSFLIALKLAQFDIIKADKGFKPLLLLDDIFDKLDDFRIAKLIEMVANDNFGQLFITDARPERSKVILKDININVKFFEVDNGVINE